MLCLHEVVASSVDSFRRCVLVESIRSIVLLVGASVFQPRLLLFVLHLHPLHLDQRWGLIEDSLVLSFLLYCSMGRFSLGSGYFIEAVGWRLPSFLAFGGEASHVGSSGLPLPMNRSHLASH